MRLPLTRNHVREMWVEEQEDGLRRPVRAARMEGAAGAATTTGTLAAAPMMRERSRKARAASSSSRGRYATFAF